jgi:hypothetical protein
MSLFDRSITPYSILAITGWLIAGVLVSVDLFVEYVADLAELGLYVAAGSAVLNVRGFVHREECRLKAAFELGRESGLRALD